MVDDPGTSDNLDGELAGVLDDAVPVGKDAVVGRARRVAERRLAQALERRAEPEGEQLQWHRGVQGVHELLESTITRNVLAAAITTFSRVCAPPPPLMSQPSSVTWSGAVDREVELLGLVEGIDEQAEARAACSVRGDDAT